jgi:hypothetical protein
MIQHHRHHQVTLVTSGYDRRISVNRRHVKFKESSRLFKAGIETSSLIAEDKSNAATFTRRIRNPPMAAIHLASCDLVAFLRTFDRLQRSPFFIKASTSIGWGVGPDRPNACTALHSLPGECFHLICPESSIKVPYPLRWKERSSPLGRLCGKPDSWRWQLMHDA